MDRFVKLIITEPIVYDSKEPPPVQVTCGTIEADLAYGEVTLPGGFKTELKQLAEAVDKLMLLARAFRNENLTFSPEDEFRQRERILSVLKYVLES